MLRIALASILLLVGVSGVQVVRAQENTPDDASPEICNPHHARVVARAFANDELFIALVSPSSAWTYDEGVLLRVHAVLEGTLPSEASDESQLRADEGPIAVCFAKRAYTRDGEATLDELVVVELLVLPEGGFDTLSGWRVVDDSGAPVTANELAVDSQNADAFGQLLVQLYDGRTMTVAALLEEGRTFVEPTPTPWPEGIPTVDPNLVGPDSGEADLGEVSGLPVVGTESDERRWWPPFIAGAFAAAACFAGGLALRLRKR